MTLAAISITSIITFLLAMIPTLYKLLEPLIQAKILTETNQQTKEQMLILSNLAQLAVSEMASLNTLDNEDRKTAAIKFVLQQLHSFGNTASNSMISAAIESAYQIYKHQLNGDIHQKKPNIQK
ncbi:phage holin, LLH family [Lentilactobacillus parakefiri]|uniref:Holin n=1 Tax=Lentilactobacillus parakefiri TaxID=152332 RepID=A0A224VGE1_9LACO|nr:hypothetical protein [Lentilactobacillus parakefiri]PAL00985.1 hypothetical protein B8W96_03525 [Lentilactobacillus parakefiri]TDG94824.1 hypothetical protein C5L28_000863 [Lentilactobacillus parakefiri]GAW71394.1 hypothetical protein LPKJCM_00474 [Lentilactobacillus parakefiri]